MDESPSPDRFERFENLKAQLLADFIEWLDPAADPDVVVDVELLLDWRFTHSGGPLDDFSAEDMREFLLSWCPRSVVVPPGQELAILEGAKAWVSHLVLTDAWRGGPVRPVLDLLDDIVPEYLEVMAAATDQPSVQDLPMTRRPDRYRVAERAAGLILVDRLDRLREYLGSGRALTSTGNPKLADARVMIDLLDTGEVWERHIDGRVRTPRSSAELSQLMFLLGVAVGAGALHHDGRTLAPTAAWSHLDAIARSEELFTAALDLGVASRGTARTGDDAGSGPSELIGGLLDDLAVHLLLPMFIDGGAVIEDMVRQAAEIVSGEPDEESSTVSDRATIDGMVRSGVLRAIDTFALLGVVDLPRRDDGSGPGDGDGMDLGDLVSITDLGRHLLERVLGDLGYVVHHSVELAGADAATAVLALSTSRTDPAVVWLEWAPDGDPVDKFDELMDVLAVAGSGPERLAAVALMEQAPTVVRRRAEAMISGPRAAYALMTLDPRDSLFSEAMDLGPVDMPDDPVSVVSDVGTDEEILLSDGRRVAAAIQGLGPERNLAPLVDLLWLEMDVDPDDLLDHVLAIDEGSVDGGEDLTPGAFTELLADMWRVDLPETGQLLAFLASNHPVRSTADAARGALARHLTTYPHHG